MSFLHKLWDETVAGPTPENGLGKLRKHNSLPVRSSSSVSGKYATRNKNGLKETGHEKVVVDPGRGLDSPRGSSSPTSPFTPRTPASHETNATSLNAYDWIVLNALDR